MSTLYQGFASDIQDVDMATAATNLNQNQTALQAALEVTAQLGQLSLLNYLPASTTDRLTLASAGRGPIGLRHERPQQPRHRKARSARASWSRCRAASIPPSRPRC